MRVLHLLDSLSRGGAETLCLDVCRNARANGLDLTFAATGGGELEDDFRRSGADFVRLTRSLPLDLKLTGQLRELILEREIEIVHCHQAVEALHAYLATRGGKRGNSNGRRVRRVLSFHLCTADAKNRLALKFLAPRMDACVAVSRELLSCLEREGKFVTGKNFHVVYNGVDASRLEATSDGGDLRAELKLTESELLFGMVGNFYADGRKDQLTVCRALPEVFARVPQAHFVFAGGHAEDASRIYEECVGFCREQGIAGRVHFLGGRADVAGVLRALDIFVFSSRKDSFGVAVVEAMLAGVPAVVSDIGALLEVTNGGEYAPVFRTGDASDLAHKIVALAGDGALRVELAEQARQWARREFGIETHIGNLLKLYKSLAGVP
ncbi:MAG TPA: glycosyltransferase family 4 protein [Pyrinomonadaceae bacterium]|jgi:glycosyltransferase involved in cell wall biosynthesis|nr:glycosyltransferase family 4 protein [Pyrinomonadaceae bacterium]